MTENICLKFLKKQRFKNGGVCPHCNHNKIYTFRDKKINVLIVNNLEINVFNSDMLKSFIVIVNKYQYINKTLK